MEVLIDLDNKTPDVGGTDYIGKVSEYYPFHAVSTETVIVYGIMKNTGKVSYDNYLKYDAFVDYYLASVPTKANRANFEWARTCIREGLHTWEPFEKYNTLGNMEISEISLFWLPTYYTKPMANKHVKHLLQTIED